MTYHVTVSRNTDTARRKSLGLQEWQTGLLYIFGHGNYNVSEPIDAWQNKFLFPLFADTRNHRSTLSNVSHLTYATPQRTRTTTHSCRTRKRASHFCSPGVVRCSHTLRPGTCGHYCMARRCCNSAAAAYTAVGNFQVTYLLRLSSSRSEQNIGQRVVSIWHDRWQYLSRHSSQLHPITDFLIKKLLLILRTT